MKKFAISKLFTVVIAMMLAVAFASCGQKEAPKAAKKDEPKKTTSAPEKKPEAKKSITIKGSDTIVNLGQKFAEEYMNKNKDYKIQVTGGGSGVGLKALVGGTTDIANASRKIKDKEVKTIEESGAKVEKFIIAKDGVTIYLNKDNPVEELSFSQLKGIFTGKVKNWKEVGGNDKNIIVYGRDSSSGTYSYVRKNVLKGEDYASTVQTLQGTAAIVQAVAKDPNGIGYGGKAYSEGIKIPKIKKADTDTAYAPDEKAVAEGKYPLARPLFMYTTDKVLAAKPEIKDYLNWILSKDGQKIVADIGFFPMPAK